MTNSILFVFIIASLAFYIYAAWSDRDKRGNSADRFYLANNSVRPSQFAAVQTGYALQMATVYPFIVLSFLGMWWIPVINTAVYMAGIILYIVWLPRFHGGSSNILGSSRTIHAAISALNNAPFLRPFTAVLTIVAFAGLGTFEIVWGASVLQILFSGKELVYYLAVSIIWLYVVIFSWTGGQGAAIRVGQYLLMLSYLGLHALVVWVVLRPDVQVGNISFPFLAPLILIFGIVMMMIRSSQMVGKREPTIKFLNLMTMLSLGTMIAALLADPSSFNLTVDISKLTAITNTSNFFLIAISVACLPIFFQFVDMTNWQRLTALRSTPDKMVKESRRGLLQYLVESPLSWLLPIFIALCAVQFLPVSDDPWSALLTSVLSSPGALGFLLAALVCVGITAIFLSTANELLTAIGYAAAYDLVPFTRNLSDKQHEGLSLTDESQAQIKMVGRWAFACASAITVGCFVLFDIFLEKGHVLIGLFLSFYTPLVALAPSLIVPAVFRRRAHCVFVVLSLFVGAVGGLALGVWAALSPEALGGAVPWLAAPFSFVTAWGLYTVGLPWGSRVIGTEGPTKAVQGGMANG